MAKREAGRIPRGARRRTRMREAGRTLEPDVRQLRAFVMLVDQGSMTAAAQRLGVAQSTVSEALAALERALGTRAITRSRGAHGIELTPAGRMLLPYARKILGDLEDARVAVATVASDVRGHVALIANESISTYLLPPALATLRPKWPNLRFAVTVGACQRIRDGLMSGQFDIGVMLQAACPDDAAASAQATNSALRLAEVPLVLFSGVKHPLAPHRAEPEIPRQRLASYPIFVSDASGRLYNVLHDYLRAEDAVEPRIEPTGSVEAVKRNVLTHPLGLGVLPEYALAEELRTGLMRALAVQPRLPSMRLEARLSRPQPPIHPALTELLAALTASACGRSQSADARRSSSRDGVRTSRPRH
jgi:DNA-binding transcriptional LysR family regulator